MNYTKRVLYLKSVWTAASLLTSTRSLANRTLDAGSVTAHTKNQSKIHDSKRLHTVFGNQRRVLMTRLMLELRWQTSVDASTASLTAWWTKKSNQYTTTADRPSQALSAPLTAKGTLMTMEKVLDDRPLRLTNDTLDLRPGEKPSDWVKRLKREQKK